MKTTIVFLMCAIALSSVSLSAQAHHRDHHHHGRPVYVQPEVEYHRHHHHHRRYETRYNEPIVQYRSSWSTPVSASVVISTPVVGLPVMIAPRYTSGDPRYITYPVPSAPPRSHSLYCRYPDGFYPAIRHCPGGWERLPSYR